MFTVLVGIGIWGTTWGLPVTFMIVMASGCETHARQLRRRTLVFYDREEASVSAAIWGRRSAPRLCHDKRAILGSVLLSLSLAIPIAFIAYADHVRKTTGVNWLGALGALVALALVITTAVISSRR